MTARRFAGFSPGKPRTFALPSAFISELLPIVDSLSELQVVLFTFWAVQQREGQHRFLRYGDYTASRPLLDALRTAEPEAPPEQTLAAALERAVNHGILLRAEVAFSESREMLYFLNAAPGRRAVEQIRLGHWRPAPGQTIEILPERPTIYQLYEANIGPLTPLIGEALADAEREYPPGWVEEAIHIAVTRNARSWRFIEAVLNRWLKEGKRDALVEKPDQRDGRRYIPDEYADLIDH
jgi:DNA replication protein